MMVALLVAVGVAAAVSALFHTWNPAPIAIERHAEAAVTRLLSGSVAPAFRLTAVDGRRYSSEALKGRPVILFAMFANCADCIPQGQALTRVARAYARSRVTVLGVDIVQGESADLLRRYAAFGRVGIPLSVYDRDVVRAYGLIVPDMTYVIGRDGRIKYVNVHALDDVGFARELDSLDRGSR